MSDVLFAPMPTTAGFLRSENQVSQGFFKDLVQEFVEVVHEIVDATVLPMLQPQSSPNMQHRTTSFLTDSFNTRRDTESFVTTHASNKPPSLAEFI